MVATPAGSTAYNLSVHADLADRLRCLGADPISSSAAALARAILPRTARVRFIIREPQRRPVSATAIAPRCVISRK